jgi:hypothetical protein
MADMGMGDMAGMKGMKGVDDTNMANMKTPAAKMKGMDPAQPATNAVPDMPGMKMAAAPAMSGSAPPGGPVKHGPDTHGPGNSAVPMETKSRLDEPGTGLENTGTRVLLYSDLRSLQPGEDPRPPGREIELHLTGNMERSCGALTARNSPRPSQSSFTTANGCASPW